MTSIIIIVSVLAAISWACDEWYNRKKKLCGGELEKVQAVVNGIAAVHADNASRMAADRGGDIPKCKPKLGTHYCER